jgi:hypothetical protein
MDRYLLVAGFGLIGSITTVAVSSIGSERPSQILLGDKEDAPLAIAFSISLVMPSGPGAFRLGSTSTTA